MSQYPGGPPYYPGWPHPPSHHPPPHHPHPHHPPPPHHHYPPPPDYGQVTALPSYPYYVPGTVMVPVPVSSVPPAASEPSQPTYITNYIYHGETTNTEAGSMLELPGEHDWVPTTSTLANTLVGRAVVGGHEGWDGSQLWVIRAWHNGDLVPGKLSVRHNAASIAYDGKEIPVQNIEVLCAKPESLRWVPSSNGSVPPSAIPGGRTASGETLYVGRARHQLSVTPGKIHPSHTSCYISFSGSEVAHKMYDVLCRVS